MIGHSTHLRFLIAGGGTAGHVLPGIAIADALVDAGVPRGDIAFAGGDRGVERKLVQPAGYALTELAGRGIQRRMTFANIGAAFSLSRGLVHGIRLVRRTRPEVVVVLGGYASFACGVGAVLCHRPLVLCEQNAKAGAVNRLLRSFARACAVSFPNTDLPRSTVTGNPLRADLAQAAQRLHDDPATVRADARRKFGLPNDRVVLLITTGSLGSTKINAAAVALLDSWRDRSDLAVRHVTGRRDFASISESTKHLVDKDDGLVYQVVEYEDDMACALSASDVALCRSGGGVAELAAFGLPAVLVPLPIAPRDHQRANANHYVERGAATLLDDDACDAARLGQALGPIIDDASCREKMSHAMAAASQVNAAQRAAELIMRVEDDH